MKNSKKSLKALTCSLLTSFAMYGMVLEKTKSVIPDGSMTIIQRAQTLGLLTGEWRSYVKLICEQFTMPEAEILNHLFDESLKNDKTLDEFQKQLKTVNVSQQRFVAINKMLLIARQVERIYLRKILEANEQQNCESKFKTIRTKFLNMLADKGELGSMAESLISEMGSRIREQGNDLKNLHRLLSEEANKGANIQSAASALTLNESNALQKQKDLVELIKKDVQQAVTELAGKLQPNTPELNRALVKFQEDLELVGKRMDEQSQALVKSIISLERMPPAEQLSLVNKFISTALPNTKVKNALEFGFLTGTVPPTVILILSMLMTDPGIVIYLLGEGLGGYLLVNRLQQLYKSSLLSPLEARAALFGFVAACVVMYTVCKITSSIPGTQTALQLMVALTGVYLAHQSFVNDVRPKSAVAVRPAL